MQFHVSSNRLALTLFVVGLLSLGLYLGTSVPIQTTAAMQGVTPIQLTETAQWPSPTPKLSLRPATQSVALEEPFTLEVRVEHAHDLVEFFFSLTFAPDIVQVDTVELGPFLGSTGRRPDIYRPNAWTDNRRGVLSFQAYSVGAQGGPSGSGTLATIRGHAKGIGQSTFHFRPEPAPWLQDSENRYYTPIVVDAVVEVGGTPGPTDTTTPTGTLSPSPEQTASPTPTPTQTPTASSTPTRTTTPTRTRTPSPSPSLARFRVYLPVITRGYKPCCHLYEPNDRYLQAYGPLERGSYRACLCAGDPEDWYYFNITMLKTITVDLAVPDEGDYDLYLYRAGSWDHSVAKSDKFGNGVPEHIEHMPTQLGRYYIRVYPYSGYSDVKPYDLTVNYD